MGTCTKWRPKDQQIKLFCVCASSQPALNNTVKTLKRENKKFTIVHQQISTRGLTGHTAPTHRSTEPRHRSIRTSAARPTPLPAGEEVSSERLVWAHAVDLVVVVSVRSWVRRPAGAASVPELTVGRSNAVRRTVQLLQRLSLSLLRMLYLVFVEVPFQLCLPLLAATHSRCGTHCTPPRIGACEHCAAASGGCACMPHSNTTTTHNASNVSIIFVVRQRIEIKVQN